MLLLSFLLVQERHLQAGSGQEGELGDGFAVEADSLERGHLGYGSLELFCTAQGNCILVRAQDSEVGDLGDNGFVHLLMDPYIH